MLPTHPSADPPSPDALTTIVNAMDVNAWDVALAVIVGIAGWVLSIFARKGTRALLARLKGISPGMGDLTARVVGYAIILLAIGVALSILGAPIQPLLSAAIIVAVVVALALRGVANNFAAGVVLQTRRPINVGDEIEVDGHTGRVRELNGRAVVLQTLDGQTIHVPNVQFLESPVINNSEHGAVRSTVEVRATLAGHSVEELAGRLVTAARATDGVQHEDRVDVLTLSVAPERATYSVRFWHQPGAGSIVSSNVVRSVTEAMAKAGTTATIDSRPLPAPLTQPDAV